MAAIRHVFTLERVVEFAADQAVVAQLPEQRHLQLEAGLAEKHPLQPRRVFGILQAQRFERAQGGGSSGIEDSLQLLHNAVAQKRPQTSLVEAPQLLEGETTNQQDLKPHRDLLLKRVIDSEAAVKQVGKPEQR